MHKIIIPHSNPNDEFVFITEWKFNDNDYVKKGDHVLGTHPTKKAAMKQLAAIEISKHKAKK